MRTCLRPPLVPASLLILADALSGFAQCAMCKTSVAAASNTDHISRVLNLGIFALLVPALLLFVAIFVLMSRWRQEETWATADREPWPGAEAEGKSLRRGWLDVRPIWNE